MTQRILYIDAIKAFLMFIVIWGHTIQYTNVYEGLNNSIAAFIYSFHMPLFMTLSGMFFNKQLTLNFLDALRKNFNRLLLPALVVSLSLFLIVFINKPRGILESINWLWNSRPWFVTTLFFCNVSTCIVYRMCKRIGLSFFLTFVIFCFIPDINERLIFMYPYFVLGYFINYLIYKRVLRGEIFFLAFLFCIFYKLNTSDITIYSSPFTLWSINGKFHFDESMYIAFKRYFVGLCGSIGFFWILRVIFCGVGRRFCNIHIVQYIGKNTLGLYLLQIGLFTIWMGIRNDYLANITYGKDWLALLLSFIVLFFLLLCIYSIRKSKIATHLILGESAK